MQRHRSHLDRGPLVTRLRRRLLARRAEEAGFVAIVMALLIPVVFMAGAAFAVDTANWYAHQRDMQKAADAAALGGVPYLPNDMANATTKALAVATRNGYTTGIDGVNIVVTVGDRPTQLKVTITKPVANTFGKVIGTPDDDAHPDGGRRLPRPSAHGQPLQHLRQRAAAAERVAAPLTHREGRRQGGRAASSTARLRRRCGGTSKDHRRTSSRATSTRRATVRPGHHGVNGCSGDTNQEYDPWATLVVKVQPSAVNKPITLQLFDAAFVNTSSDCRLPAGERQLGLSGSGNANPYVTKADARNRYSDNGTTAQNYCTGDQLPRTDDSINSTPTTMTTSFVLRAAGRLPGPDFGTGAKRHAGSPASSSTGDTPSYSSGSFSWSANDLTSGQKRLRPELARSLPQLDRRSARSTPTRRVTTTSTCAATSRSVARPGEQTATPADLVRELCRGCRDWATRHRARGQQRVRDPGGDQRWSRDLGRGGRVQPDADLDQLDDVGPDVQPDPGAPRRGGPAHRVQLLRRG